MPKQTDQQRAARGVEYHASTTRIPKEMHSQISDLAKQEGWTFNRMLIALLTLGLSEWTRRKQN